jgi:delta 1-pyrroline-5-carboxylate dehydrogenase
MSTNVTRFSDAHRAFNQWHLLEIQQRETQLNKIKKHLAPPLLSAFEYQMLHASKHVGSTISLISPTGESNELYTQGRGVAVMLIESTEEQGYPAVIAMLTAILTAGNSLIVCCDDESLNKLLNLISQDLNETNHLVQLSNRESYSELLQQDIRNFAFIGSKQNAVKLNTELAAKPNAITLLVAETDLVSMPRSLDPALVLWFVTERVRTINITAIGGNAMLLELGNSAH